MKLILMVLCGALALLAQGPVPRLAPELKIVEASGKTTILSDLRGSVVLLGLISTECPHCQRVSGVFEQLSHELSGLRVAEVAFNGGADTAAFVKKFGLSFPVGSATEDSARAFLGIERGARLGTPQIVIIDRAGVIRAQSERVGSPILQVHDYLYAVLTAVAR